MILPPLTGLFGMYFYVTNTLPHITLEQVANMSQLYDSVLQLACLANLVPFMIFYYVTRFDIGAKGIITSTFLWFIIVAILKFV